MWLGSLSCVRTKTNNSKRVIGVDGEQTVMNSYERGWPIPINDQRSSIAKIQIQKHVGIQVKFRTHIL